MDVDADKEALFNEVYDTEHIPIFKVPGVRGVTRMKGEPFAFSIGGEEKEVALDGPRYSAIYEIDGPHVLVSPEWAKAVEAGRWPSRGAPLHPQPPARALQGALTAHPAGAGQAASASPRPGAAACPAAPPAGRGGLKK